MTVTWGQVAIVFFSRRLCCWCRVALVTGCVGMALGVLGIPAARAAAWSIQPVPTAAYPGGHLNAVSCTSSRACTAVGSFLNGSQSTLTEGIQPLAERWDGSAWSLQRVPGGGGHDQSLNGVSCPARRWCVAVGFDRDSSNGGFEDGMLVEHWNGVRWTVRGVYDSGNLAAVSCPSPRACIAVGTTNSYYGDGGLIQAVAERWNGRRWSAQALSLRGGWKQTSLGSVSCASAGACLAVGSLGTGKGCRPEGVERHAGW